jgi:hypothetical protein
MYSADVCVISLHAIRAKRRSLREPERIEGVRGGASRFEALD